MTSPTVSSASNPRIKAAARLRARRHRDRTATFLVEGYRELARAIEAGVRLRELFCCPSLYLGSHEDALVRRAAAAGADVVETTPKAFGRLSYRDRAEGLVGVAEQFPTGLDDLPPLARPGLVLVAEGIEKPGNLGAMLRTAAAAGAGAVVVCDRRTDPFNPNVVRSSIGTVFCVPLAVTSTPDAVEWVLAAGLTPVAASPDAESVVWDTDLTGPLAIVVGSEQYGLSEAWMGAGPRASVPMPGPVDSLNAATAAAVLLFEALRQRHAKRP